MDDSFIIPWSVVHQSPLSMGFSRQEYLHSLLFPSPRDLPDPEIELVTLALSGSFFTIEPPGKPFHFLAIVYKAVLNIDVPICLWDPHFSFFRYMSQSSIIGSYSILLLFWSIFDQFYFCFKFFEETILFSIMAAPFPPIVYMHSNLSTSSPTLFNLYFYNIHSKSHEILSHGFDFHFTDD